MLLLTGGRNGKPDPVIKVFGFHSSSLQVSLPEYCDKMKAGQREIFYLSAPSRQLAENSPYYENLKKADTEVLSNIYLHFFGSWLSTLPMKIGTFLLRALRRAGVDAAPAV